MKLKLFFVMSCMLALSACEQRHVAAGVVPSAVPKSDAVMVSVDQVNYNADREIKYSAFDVSGAKPTEPIAGGIVAPLEAGGAKNCCVGLPKTWHAGIKLKVEWQEAERETRSEMYQQTVEIPNYAAPSDVYLVFHPEHQLEVVVSGAEPGHAEWAGKMKLKPLDACMQQHKKKFCYQSIPKYAWGTKEYKASQYRKSCQPAVIAANKAIVGSNNETEECMKWVKECIESWSIDKAMCHLDYQE